MGSWRFEASAGRLWSWTGIVGLLRHHFCFACFYIYLWWNCFVCPTNIWQWWPTGRGEHLSAGTPRPALLIQREGKCAVTVLNLSGSESGNRFFWQIIWHRIMRVVISGFLFVFAQHWRVLLTCFNINVFEYRSPSVMAGLRSTHHRIGEKQLSRNAIFIIVLLYIVRL